MDILLLRFGHSMIDDHCETLDMKTGKNLEDIDLLSSFGSTQRVDEDNGWTLSPDGFDAGWRKRFSRLHHVQRRESDRIALLFERVLQIALGRCIRDMKEGGSR